MGRAHPAIFLAGLLGADSTAHANPEPTALYEGRHAAMGGTAVAYTDNATAIFHNPAGLGHVEHASFDVTSALLYVRYRVPFAGEGSEIASPPIFGPPPFIGGAVRAHRRLVFGGAFYFATAFGGRFRNIPRLDDYTPRTPCSNAALGVVTDCTGPNDTVPVTDVTLQTTSSQSVTFFVVEAAASMSVEVTPRLRFGLSLRLPWAQQATSSDQEILSGSWRSVNQVVQGFARPRPTMGFQWDVTDSFTLAGVYRMRADIPLEGTTRVNIGYDVQDAVNVVDARSEWFTPHMFRVGAAWWTLDRRLLLTAEFRAQFHQAVNRSQRFDLSDDMGLTQATGLTKIEAPFDWYNVFYPSLGAQYQMTQTSFARLGFSMGRAATPTTTLSPFTPPPGRNYSLSAGFGLEVGHWTLDLGYQMATGNSAVVTQRNSINCSRDAAQKSGCPGIYGLDAHTIVLSATFNR